MSTNSNSNFNAWTLGGILALCVLVGGSGHIHYVSNDKAGDFKLFLCIFVALSFISSFLELLAKTEFSGAHLKFAKEIEFSAIALEVIAKGPILGVAILDYLNP